MPINETDFPRVHGELIQGDDRLSNILSNSAALTAIDLYSGVGGWALGLKMAGIHVSASYELSEWACATQLNNQGGNVFKCDIRERLSFLPTDVDIVVGSPPCTEFSLSNRGGAGDIENGMKDLDRFLTTVEDTKPRYWILENVPRVKSILHEHVYSHKGKLKKFRSLFDAPGVHVRVFDMAQFGLPQKRLRCIAGCYPAELLDAYAHRCRTKLLSDVIASLTTNVICDPIYGFHIERSKLTEHNFEPPLTREEVRLNRDSKRFHPIYNRMEFPDRINRPVRAITATCTRVSRESVVIRSEGEKNKLRRLTLRERACLQGFPITYQFYAPSVSKKMELIGNAIPPLFVYYLGCALQGIEANELKHPDQIKFDHRQPPQISPVTHPIKLQSRYPAQRRFRATIPFLRFKSGVRFELSNEFRKGAVSWRVTFLFGNSKDIRVLRPDGRHNRKLEKFLRSCRLFSKMKNHRKIVTESAASLAASDLQQRWNHRARGDGPHAVVGALARVARVIANNLKELDQQLIDNCLGTITPLHAANRKNSLKTRSINRKKFERNAVALLAGLILASYFNSSTEVKCNALCPLPHRQQ